MSCPNHRRPWKQAKMLVATHLNGQRVILAGRRQVNRRRKGLACDAARCGCVGACSGRRKSARQSGPQDLLALHRRHPTRRRRRRRVIANHLKFLKKLKLINLSPSPARGPLSGPQHTTSVRPATSFLARGI